MNESECCQLCFIWNGFYFLPGYEYPDDAEHGSNNIHGIGRPPLCNMPVIRKHPFQGKGIRYLKRAVLPDLSELYLGVFSEAPVDVHQEIDGVGNKHDEPADYESLHDYQYADSRAHCKRTYV